MNKLKPVFNWIIKVKKFKESNCFFDQSFCYHLFILVDKYENDLIRQNDFSDLELKGFKIKDVRLSSPIQVESKLKIGVLNSDNEKKKVPKSF